MTDFNGRFKKNFDLKKVYLDFFQKTRYNRIRYNRIMKEKSEKIYTIEELREKLTPVFDRAPVYRAVVFGSYMNGNADAESDVDIIIDSKNELTGFNFFGVMGSAEDIIGKRVDMYDVREIKSESPIFKFIQEGIVIYER